ncbi:hypothetical protein ABMA27_006726 [Loxostege sticticalis]|uniref:THAP-type domain-containing protein n=1 Tax=Loxostege sticticalis TaxID=481309 RepID=A0ABR3IK83_LOXSC
MPSCVVKWCKNNTTSQKKCLGITFHRFPTGNEPWKDDWTRIIKKCRGQEDWSASKSCVVCSIHFDQNDLYTTSKGRRRLVTYATRIKLFMQHPIVNSQATEQKISCSRNVKEELIKEQSKSLMSHSNSSFNEKFHIKVDCSLRHYKSIWSSQLRSCVAAFSRYSRLKLLKKKGILNHLHMYASGVHGHKQLGNEENRRGRHSGLCIILGRSCKND